MRASVKCGSCFDTEHAPPNTQGNASWTYLKTEGLSNSQLKTRGFTHLLSARDRVPGFVQRAAVDGFRRLRLQKALPPLALETEPQVWIHCAQ